MLWIDNDIVPTTPGYVDLLTDEYDPHAALFDHFVQFLEDVEEGRLELNRRDILIRLVALSGNVAVSQPGYGLES